MQTLLRIFSLVLLSATTLTYSGCKKDDPVKSVTDTQIEILKGSWKATEAKADNLPQDDYGNFILTFSGKAGNPSLNYTLEGRPFVSPWPDSGILSFDDTDPRHLLLRDDDVMVAYEVTGALLTLSFNFSGEGYVNGRTSSLTGEWQFKFQRQ